MIRRKSDNTPPGIAVNSYDEAIGTLRQVIRSTLEVLAPLNQALRDGVPAPGEQDAPTDAEDAYRRATEVSARLAAANDLVNQGSALVVEVGTLFNRLNDVVRSARVDRTTVYRQAAAVPGVTHTGIARRAGVPRTTVVQCVIGRPGQPTTTTE